MGHLEQQASQILRKRVTKLRHWQRGDGYAIDVTYGGGARQVIGRSFDDAALMLRAHALRIAREDAA